MINIKGYLYTRIPAPPVTDGSTHSQQDYPFVMNTARYPTWQIHTTEINQIFNPLTCDIYP